MSTYDLPFLILTTFERTDESSWKFEAILTRSQDLFVYSKVIKVREVSVIITTILYN